MPACGMRGEPRSDSGSAQGAQELWRRLWGKSGRRGVYSLLIGIRLELRQFRVLL